jgi:formyltetrahydrofolate deformylase
MNKKYILTLSCPDKVGIVAEVSGFLAANGCNIMESAQYNDVSTQQFFMRVVFECAEGFKTDSFAAVGKKFAMDWEINDSAKKARVLILASKSSHCLNHLLHRKRIGTLNIEVPMVISNHPDLKEMADWHKIPFVQIANKEEKAIIEAIDKYNIDLIVLARYMQILSPELSRKLKGKAINIHHSFLPSFKGANPYNQAFQRGVKIIGATAHYVTDDLDEGPIIDQEVIRVDHTYTPERLVSAGSDIENLVLARAVQNHIEHRVLLNGNKTVVFK